MNHMPLPRDPDSFPLTGRQTFVIFGAVFVGFGIVMALIDTCTEPRDDPAQGEGPDDITTRGRWADARYFLLACVWWTVVLPLGATVGLLLLTLTVLADSCTPEDPSPPDVDSGPAVAQTSGDHRRYPPPPPAASSSPPDVFTESTHLVSATSSPPAYLGVGAPVI